MERIKVREEKNGFFISLSNPSKRNAIDEKMINELNSFFSDQGKFSDKKFVLIEGEGDIFCAGGDLMWMLEKGQKDFDTNFNDAINLAVMYKRIWECPIPVILKLLGGAWGGGVGFLAVSDIVIAQKDAKIRLPEVKIGLVPAVISVFLIKKIGLSHFLNLAILAKEITAEEAEKIGLVNISVSKDEINNIENKIIEEISNTPANSLSMTKRLSRIISTQDMENSIKHAAEFLARSRSNEETQKRIKDFLEKK